VSDPSGADDAPTAKGFLHRSFDVCVFAPVGMAITVAEDLPELVAKGRAHVERDINNARVVGRFVVHREWRRAVQRLASIFGSDQPPAAPGDPDEPAPRRDPAASHAASRTEPPAVSQPEPPAATSDTPSLAYGRPVIPDAAAEAIVGSVLADYDTLSASQVVRRLESLGPDELRAVQRYEASTRNRRTILNRASQLLDQGPAAAQSG
jgi:hypothetical protein